MKKRIPMILLLLSPYLYLLIALLCMSSYSSSSRPENVWLVVVVIHFAFVVVFFIPNMIYAFVLAVHGEKSNVLLFWDMLIKLCNIPIYIVIFLIGVFTTMMPTGIILTLVLVIFDYLLLLPSSMYGISGLIQARREMKITTTVAVVNGILHFFFCADVISAMVMFYKTKDKRQTI